MKETPNFLEGTRFGFPGKGLIIGCNQDRAVACRLATCMWFKKRTLHRDSTYWWLVRNMVVHVHIYICIYYMYTYTHKGLRLEGLGFRWFMV